MKKYVFIIPVGIIIVAVVFLLYFNKTKNIKDTIALTKKSDFVFASEYNDELFIASDNNLQIYRNGLFQEKIDITNGIRNAYAEKDKIYFIDDDNYFSVLYLSDNSYKKMIKNVIDYSIDAYSIAIVSDDNLLYVYNKSNIEEYRKIENIKNVRSVKLYNGYLLAIDNCRDLFEISSLDTQPLIKKIKDIQEVDSVYCGYGNIAQTVNGDLYYWFKDYYSDFKDPYIDPPSEIAEELSSHNVDKFAFGTSICIGWKKGGKAYYWGCVGTSDKRKEEVFARKPTEIKGVDNVEEVYVGIDRSSIIYIKTGSEVIKYSLK